ncbi:unnamed protein product [Mytilus coruscus]|uniref:G-protein coupled receptors family 2 profile 2 domain-containing protein n=1 Tax=Mytilus coruscus TaxID=42192 RepID=A0A6J8DN79_MYTCO|nr:unnamed protein product [Mytilus coruscus]
MFIKSNERWHSTGFEFESRLNQLKADLKNNPEKKFCAKSIIECETWRDSDNPRTVIKELTCVDFIQKQPTVASTNINMNVITYTVVITKQSLGIRDIRRSNSFQYLPVFVRISLVTGMLWITGLLGAIIQNELMEYLFVICCSFQGLLIAVGNLTTKRIYRELRKRKPSLSK